MPKPELCYNSAMILVTGSTGFIGKNLIKKLESNGLDFRLLLTSGANRQRLPTGKQYDIALSSMEDVGSLRSAFNKIESVFHLIGGEAFGSRADLGKLEVKNLETLVTVARQAGVKRFFYISHLGADRNSAYGLLKAKGMGEEVLKKSGVAYTIFRPGWLFGEGDHFTESIARLIRKYLGFFFLPGEGQTLLQPLWIEDFTTALLWSLDREDLINKTIELGGAEQLSYREIAQTVANAMNRRIRFLNISPVQYSFFTQMIENQKKNPPINVYWMDYLAENRTCDLDSMSRIFEINPARLKQKIPHLARKQKRK